MRIHSIQINELNSLQDAQVFFPQPDRHYFGQMNLSIIVGENGTGKTTILNFLSQVFNPSQRKNLLTESKIHYELKGKGLSEYDEYELKHNQYGQLTQVLQRKDNNYKKTISITNYPPGPSKVIVSTYSPHEQYIRRSNSKYKYVGASGNIKSLFLPIIEIVSSNDFMKKKALKNLLAEIGYPNIPLIELDPNLFNEEYANQINKNKIDFIEEKNHSLTALKSHYETYSVLINEKRLLTMDSLQHFPGGRENWLKAIKKFRVYSNTRIENLWCPKGDLLIPITSFSSGEMTLYFRIFRIVHVISENSLVLIDEPETHLHPKWIQKYIMILKNVFKDYRSHFIIATHSPIITSDVPRECLIALRKKDGKVVPYQIEDKTLGTSPREILHEVFGLKSYIGDLTNKTVEDIKKLLLTEPQKDSYEYRKIILLYRDLGDSDRKYELFDQLSAMYPEEFGYVED